MAINGAIVEITIVGGPLAGNYAKFEDIPANPIGMTEDLSEDRAKGRLVHRAELDNKPEYEGYAGPMWDGDGYRYETWEVYDMLSR